MRDDFDGDDLRIVYFISQGLNMSSISIRLGISPQRVSQRISRLESICKTSLIYKKNGIQLTAAGKLVANLAENVNMHVGTFKKDLANLRSDHGQLRIIGVASLLLNDVPAVLKNVIKEYPHLRVKLTNGNAEDITNAVKEGAADIGLIAKQRQIDGLTFRAYKKERICLLVHPEHSLAKLKKATFKQASEHPFIDYDHSNVITSYLAEGQIRSHTYLNIAVRASCLEIAAQYACAGHGISMTLESIADRYKKLGGKKILLEEKWANVELTSCTKRMARLSPAINFFNSELQRHFKKSGR
jgi:DNA-binding transcriptional LysR family regulator